MPRQLEKNKMFPGKKFSKLTCLWPSKTPLKYVYRCDCGNIKDINKSNVASGMSRSCGCLFKELARKKATVHGHASKYNKSPTYITWISMKQRCLSENHHAYKDYGGRGIRIDSNWKIFQNFLSDMGERPSGTSLDRIDVNGNYTKENCRWATPTEQSNNRRNYSQTEIDGEIYKKDEFIKKFGLPIGLYKCRLALGWTHEEALSGIVNDKHRNNRIDNMIKNNVVLKKQLEAAYAEDSDYVEAILYKLSMRDYSIIKSRLGLGLLRKLSLQELGDKMNITRERVRQIEAKALIKIYNNLSY